MKKTVIIVGERLGLMDERSAFLLRTIKTSLHDIDNLLFLHDITLDSFLKLETLLQDSSHVVLAALKTEYLIISKMVATLLNDHLIAKEGFLIPSLSTLYEGASYVVPWNNTQINGILVAEEGNISPLLIEDEAHSADIHLFGVEVDSALILLSGIVATYDASISAIKHPGGWTQLNVKTHKYGALTSCLDEIRTFFPQKSVCAHNIAAFVVNVLIRNGLKISCAESCTGGRLASLITGVAGSSSVFDGSLITYANNLKSEWLGVFDDSLEHYGAVSEKVVLEMLDGVLTTSKADFALAISGIAGPSGGTPTKPVGTVFVGFKGSNSPARVERLLLQGDREYIQMSAAYHALRLFLEENSEILKNF